MANETSITIKEVDAGGAGNLPWVSADLPDVRRRPRWRTVPEMGAAMSSVARRPRLLDLFCGAGGAGMGYHRAGFDVVGVDINPQPDYPFEFRQGDALDYLTEHGHEFDARHASPPCQASCTLTKGTNKGRKYLDLIPSIREALESFDGPSIIENVQGADIRRDLTLCGEMFGLGVIRHRYFELSGFLAPQPKHRKHRGRVAGYRHGQWYEGPYVAVYGNGGGKGTVPEWQAAMGIDWTDDRKRIAEAIPPAFTEHIGRRLIAHMLDRSRLTTTTTDNARHAIDGSES